MTRTATTLGALALTAFALLGCGHHPHPHEAPSPWKTHPTEALQGTWLMRTTESSRYDIRVIIQGDDANFVTVDGDGRTGALSQGPNGVVMIRIGESSLDAPTEDTRYASRDALPTCHDDHDAEDHDHGDAQEDDHAHPDGEGHPDDHDHADHDHGDDHDHEHGDHAHDHGPEGAQTLHVLLRGPHNGVAWIPTTGQVYELVRPQPLATSLQGEWEECNPRALDEIAKVTVTAERFELRVPGFEPDRLELLGMVQSDRSDLIKLVARSDEGWLALNVRWVEPGESFIAWPDGAEGFLFFYFRPGAPPPWASCHGVPSR